MAETLDQRQVEASHDGGITYFYYNTYPTADEACKAVRELSERFWPGVSFKRACFKPSKNPDGKDK